MELPGTRNNVAALTQRHPAPERGWLRWSMQIQTYHGSGPTGRVAADCRRYTGGTMFRVVPFTLTGYTSNVAGGRLPPLRQRTTFLHFLEHKTAFDRINIRYLQQMYCRGGNLLPATYRI